MITAAAATFTDGLVTGIITTTAMAILALVRWHK